MTGVLESQGEGSSGLAYRGRALWEAGAVPFARLAPPLLVTALTAPFWGMALVLLFAFPAASTHWAPLDLSEGMLARYASILFLLGLSLLLIGAALIRGLRLRYRVTRLTVELWRGTSLGRRMGIAEIRTVTVQTTLAGQRVRIRSGAWGGIEMVLHAQDALRLLEVLRSLGVEESEIAVPAGIASLTPEEPVRWSGVPGLASFDTSRAIVTGALLSPPLLCLALLYWAWNGNSDPFFGLFQTLFILALVGWPALVALIAFGERLVAWFLDAFGAILVTDRRIAWCAPWSRRIYRELALTELVDAGIVEQKGHRAWVALTIRSKRDDVRSEDLRGIRNPEQFLAALKLGPRA